MKRIVAALIATLLLLVGYFIYSNLNHSKKNSTGLNNDMSIAVLPFVDMNKDGNQEYLSDGLTEGILNSLAQLKGLKVCARTSSFQFKGKEFDVREAGKILGVQNLLEGSFQNDGKKIRITAQLINADDGFHFWSEQYDGNIEDIFIFQDKIAKAIAAKLGISLLGRDKSTSPKVLTHSKEAFEFYTKGRTSWNLRTPPELKKGIEFFRQAIELDSLFAGAYTGIADCYTALGYGSFLSPDETFPKAYKAATKALQLDPTLAEAHASMGYYRFYYDWDWALAEDEFRRAIALNPNCEIGYDWYGYYLTAMERYDEAAIILKKAADLDPLSAAFSTDIGFSMYYNKDYDGAMTQLQTALKLKSTFPLGLLWLGRTYQAKKMYPEAIVEYNKALKASADWPVALAQIGNVYGVDGNRKEAEKILNTLNALTTTKFVTPYGIALVYAGMGEKEQALHWLDEAYKGKSHWLVWLKSDPRWTFMRSDKRFIELVNKVGLPN